MLAPNLDDYMMYNGNEQVYTYTFRTSRKDNCPHCRSIKSTKIVVSQDITLEELMNKACQTKVFKKHINKPLNKPSIFNAEKKFYMSSPTILHMQTKGNLEKKLKDLMEHEDEVVLTSEGWGIPYPFIVAFEEEEMMQDN